MVVKLPMSQVIFTRFIGWFTMARNANANEDIPYKYTIDEIRLRVISDLQENYKMYKSYLVLPHMEEAKWESNFAQLWLFQEGHRKYVIN